MPVQKLDRYVLHIYMHIIYPLISEFIYSASIYVYQTPCNVYVLCIYPLTHLPDRDFSTSVIVMISQLYIADFM